MQVIGKSFSCANANALNEIKNSVKFGNSTLGIEDSIVLKDADATIQKFDSRTGGLKAASVPYNRVVSGLFGELVPGLYYSTPAKLNSKFSADDVEHFRNSKEIEEPKETKESNESNETKEIKETEENKEPVQLINYLHGVYLLNEDLIAVFNLDPKEFETERKRVAMNTELKKVKASPAKIKVKGQEKQGSKHFKMVKSNAQFTHIEIAWRIIFNLKQELSNTVIANSFKDLPKQKTIELKKEMGEVKQVAKLDYVIFGIVTSQKKTKAGEPPAPIVYKLVKFNAEEEVSEKKPLYTFRIETSKEKKVTQVGIKKLLKVPDPKTIKIAEFSNYIPKTLEDAITAFGFKVSHTSKVNNIDVPIYTSDTLYAICTVEKKESASKGAAKSDFTMKEQKGANVGKPTVALSEIGSESQTGLDDDDDDGFVEY